MADKPTIHILGAGALGSLWAAKLSLKNHVILLIKPTEPSQNGAIEPLTNHTFQLIDQNQTTTYSLPCEYSGLYANNHDPIKRLLVFTKSYDTLSAIKQLRNRITPSTHIVLFQNGLGSQQAVMQLFPENAIHAASTTEGANRLDKHNVIYAGKGETWVGLISGAQRQINFEDMSTLLSRSGLKITASQNIWERLWLKLAINCAINPFTALLNCKNGELIGQPLFDTHISPLCHELSAAMQNNSIEIPPAALQAIVEDVIKKTANNVSSMLQDVRAGKQTEIEYINGYIETTETNNGQRFPVNLSLLEEVRKIAINA